eukprot:TRINITY_DN6282_c0_g1_i1.p1 TRINITY_DN6282_c0_g1~~TRINITY_DN6282_c0_g1_i1.p1  ORF type:complete len:134 (+),score=16.34 TRINITY_DN6282_c0_g1_i1:87-488(+)
MNCKVVSWFLIWMVVAPTLAVCCGYCPPATVKPSPAPATTSPTPPSPVYCPINVLKLGACVDLLGGLVHVSLGDPAVNTCCPLIAGVADVEAALCLCTTLKLKLLSLNVYLPLALELLVACGKNPPPGFKCPP